MAALACRLGGPLLMAERWHSWLFPAAVHCMHDDVGRLLCAAARTSALVMPCA